MKNTLLPIRKTYLHCYALILFFLFSFSPVKSGVYYWVGGTGNWSQYNTHWATASGGLIFHTHVPSPLDTVIFDNNSFTAAGQTVFADTTLILCNTMNWSGANFNPTFKISPTITYGNFKIYGSLILTSQMNWNFYGVINFEATSPNKIINTAGQTLTSTLNFNGIGGGWNLQDSLVGLYAPINFNSGTFRTNNFAVHGGFFSLNAMNPCGVYLGTSRIYGDWQTGNVPFTLDADSSTIICNSFFSDVNRQYHNLIYTSGFGNPITTQNCSFDKILLPVGGTIDFSNCTIDTLISNGMLTAYSGSTVNYARFDNDVSIAGTFTTFYLNNPGHTFYSGGIAVNGQFIANGTCADPIIIEAQYSWMPGQISKPSGNVICSNLILKNVDATGGATFTANNSYALSGVTGWTVNSPAAQAKFWIGGQGNWDDINHWSATSGGTGGVCPPGPNDNVFFDANSFPQTNDTLFFNTSNAFCKNMNWTGVLNSPAIKFTSNGPFLDVSGSMILSPNMSWNHAGIITFTSSQLNTIINPAGQTFYGVSFDGSGEFILQDSLSSYGTSFINGTFSSNNKTIRGGADLSSANVVNIKFGTSEIYGNWYSGTTIVPVDFDSCTFYSSFFDCSNGYTYNTIVIFDGQLNLTFSTVKKIVADANSILNTNGCNVDTLISPGSSFLNGSTSVFQYADIKEDFVINSDNTFSVFNLSNPNYVLTLASGSTQTITSQLNASGTCSAGLTTINSSTTGSSATINKASGTVNVSYCVLKDVDATGGATFNAFNCLSGGNITGWNFTSLSGQNHYWVGGQGNWDDPAHWSTVSGGAGGACIPNQLDNVFFDANSFPAPNDTLFLIVNNANCATMDWTGVTNNPVVEFPPTPITKKLFVYGSLLFSPNMTLDSYNEIHFCSTAPGNIIKSSSLVVGNVSFDGVGGEWSLADSLTTVSVKVNSGKLFTNNNNIEGFTVDVNAVTPVTLKLGTSVIRGGWNAAVSPFILDADSCIFSTWNGFTSAGGYDYNEIYSFNSIGSGTSIQGGHVNKLIANGNGSGGVGLTSCTVDSLLTGGTSLYYFGSSVLIHNAVVGGGLNVSGNSTFDTLIFNNPGSTVILQASSTQTVNNYLAVNSSPGFPVSIQSSTIGVSANIQKAADTVCLDNLFLKDISVSGGAQFYSGTNSVDLGNNTGWLWTSCSLPFTNVWPGDANYDLITDNLDIVYIGLAYNNTGYVRPSASLTYSAQPCQDWSTIFTNLTNVKNADCNGNGIVNANDTIAVSLNYGTNHPAKLGNFQNQISSGPDLFFSPATTTYSPGSIVSVPVDLGTTANPANNFYGIAFRINYDASKIVPGSVGITYNGSWLTPAGNIVHLEKDFYSSQYIDAGVARINHNNSSGNGLVANFIFQIKPTAAPGPINFSISNVTAMDNVENIISVNTITNSIDVGEAEISAENNLIVFPNPFSDQTTISYSLLSSEKVVVNVFTPEGILVCNLEGKTKSAGEHKIVFDTKELSSGIYFCKIIIGGKRKVFKLVKG